MIRRILLPTDGSEHGEKTIRFAVELARVTGASIVAMYAFNPPHLLRHHGSALMEELRTSLEAEAKEIIDDVARRIVAEGVTVRALAVEGPPAEAILRTAEAEQPDIIILGSRSDAGLPGLLLGSVAEKVVRHAPMTVTVVK